MGKGLKKRDRQRRRVEELKIHRRKREERDPQMKGKCRISQLKKLIDRQIGKQTDSDR